LLDLPEDFRRNVTAAFPTGAAWLDSLPGLLVECEERWQIRIGPPFDLSFNYVAPATTADREEVVVKLAVPGPEVSSEITALQLYAGEAAVQLLQFDEHRGFLLLERLRPGATLSSITDDVATRIAARIMRELWRPLPADHRFPTVEPWAKELDHLRPRFGGGTGPFPQRLVEMAESLFRELIASSDPPVLLHGDLHHFNILSAERRPWIAIDPKGLAGEPAYDVGALLRNPNPQLCTDVEIQRRRIDVLREELGLDAQRMIGWGVAQTVLSAWWSYEGGEGDWESTCVCAESLARLLH
jgi:streptomycin 6-kinase